MFITKIKIVALYGLHDYDIYFEEEHALKIIHAPNGYGKTTILRLIKAILEGEVESFRQIPFKRFLIVFNQKESVEVYRKEKQLFYELHIGQEKNCYNLENKQEDYLSKLRMITNQIPIYFIESNRLWLRRKEEQLEEAKLLPTVLVYAKKLSELMREALAVSNYCSQALDRSFPSRLLEWIKQEQETLSYEEIQKRLIALEEKRSVLASVGLFSNTGVSIPDGWDKNYQYMSKVLSLYIKDSEEKLKPFEQLSTKINVLCRLINKHFVYKDMEVNMKDGFVFKVSTNEVLKADKLSPGEQNELILIFKLLFEAPSHAIILMDEPEISLHIAWQQSFLEDMKMIAGLAHIRMIIATHSPDIINGRWDLTTGLEQEV